MSFSENLAKRMLQPINTSVILLLGVGTMVWGAWVGNPFWGVFDRAEVFQNMAGVAPEWAWGLLAIVVGIAMVYGVIRPSYRSLLFGAAAGGWNWFLVSVFYLVGDIYSPAWIPAMIFAVYAGFVFLNIKVNKNIHEWTNKEATDHIRHKRY